jgi:superfamily II DNA or RNA helicase
MNTQQLATLDYWVSKLRERGIYYYLDLLDFRQFKEGDTDILVTVAMAHVGYDHKPISVVTCLNHYREWSWLDQFAARGMRMMAELPRGDQLLHYIGPNDRLNVRWADAKRRESDQGLRERRERPGPGPDGSSVEPRLSAPGH